MNNLITRARYKFLEFVRFISKLSIFLVMSAMMTSATAQLKAQLSLLVIIELSNEFRMFFLLRVKVTNWRSVRLGVRANNCAH